jgi:hypothetical protein
MYQSFPRTSSTLASVIRDDIFSLLGNSGKTLFTPDSDTFSFSFRFFFSSSLRRIMESIDIMAHRRLLTYITLCILTLFALPTETSFAAETVSPPTEKTFIVTAYYSPLPGQKSYQMWSYSADIRLNGNGTHGANGTPVFTGMIAAPKTYAFGTHIFFDGLGLGRVEDRGGAIVEAFERWQPYDRLDIWVGYGDDGLYRAKKWGRRIVKWSIVSWDTLAIYPMFNIAGIGKTGADGVDFARFPVPGSNISTTLNQDMLDLFADLGYIVKNGDTTAMLIQFQLDQQIIRSRTDEDAGIYGPKTRTALAALYTQFQSKQASDIISMEKERKLLIGEHDSWQDGYNKAQEQVQTWGQPRLRESGDGVRSLQEWLRDSGHYREPITGQMTPQTLSALRKYQKSKNIKTTGKLDENTRWAMIEDIMTR